MIQIEKADIALQNCLIAIAAALQSQNFQNKLFRSDFGLERREDKKHVAASYFLCQNLVVKMSWI
jgi:hypothetical protein